uniref:XPG-I domain-containing protein n=1 Tax=Fagus sylvatica TaxID=28930 RepID=A0A2N9JAR5_FAGSY
MGVGGNFWDLLKPYARPEGPDFLRNKRVAVDLSYWIVQHETAIKARVRNPHLRLTFFRTINLFSKARIARFFRASGIELSDLPVAEEGVSVERNRAFSKCVQECVELLELFGMPVVKAKGEAEALCAQLDSEGYVDACITADSDAFLFGATCVIKCVRPNSKEPFECYHMSDIEAGLGLKRKHLIAISLLVGNDHDLNGVQGIGLESALRFVQAFTEDEILNRLHEIGRGDSPLFQGGIKSLDDSIPGSGESSPKIKCSHCSLCGHPGSKRAHFKFSCEYCSTSNGEGCMKKPEGFKCDCSSCDMVRREKEQKKKENWRIKVCNKIAMESNFPNNEIIKMYLCDTNGYFTEKDGPCISWGNPKTEMLVDFIAFHQPWEPSYIRRMMLPMLSTIFLRQMAKNPVKTLLYGQYEFDSILRVKTRYGHQFYVVKWKKAAPALGSVMHTIPSEESDTEQDVEGVDDSLDLWEESDGPKIHVDEGSCYLLTDENMDIVRAAFPEEVNRFLHEKELKESKRKKSSSLRSEGTNEKLELKSSRGVQLSITEFYRSTKVQVQVKPGEDLPSFSNGQGDGTSKEKRKVSNPNLSKSVRRRLLFK